MEAEKPFSQVKKSTMTLALNPIRPSLLSSDPVTRNSSHIRRQKLMSTASACILLTEALNMDAVTYRGECC
jgi:hypothetical protein